MLMPQSNLVRVDVWCSSESRVAGFSMYYSAISIETRTIMCCSFKKKNLLLMQVRRVYPELGLCYSPKKKSWVCDNASRPSPRVPSFTRSHQWQLEGLAPRHFEMDVFDLKPMLIH